MVASLIYGIFHLSGTHERTRLAFGTGIDLAVEEICRAGR